MVLSQQKRSLSWRIKGSLYEAKKNNAGVSTKGLTLWVINFGYSHKTFIEVIKKTNAITKRNIFKDTPA